MANWVLHSLIRGIRTERYREGDPLPSGSTPGRPQPRRMDESAASALAEYCPTGALRVQFPGIRVDFSRCIHCQRCRGHERLEWRQDATWATHLEDARKSLGGSFRRALHVRYLDAGACGGCMGEARLIDAPQYNLHRYGIFITPTPRDADILLVAGPVTEALRRPLLDAYEAMPEPKRVVAMGVCAINGGVFGKSFASCGGAAEVVPVDIVIPGCPPPPRALIEGLLLAVGRSHSAQAVEAP